MADTPTVHLGQFTDEHATEIGDRLDEAGIVWWQKRSGLLTRLLFAGDWGVRLFVEEDRLGDAREIAEEITGPGDAGGDGDSPGGSDPAV